MYVQSRIVIIPKVGFLELNLKQSPAQHDRQWTAIYVEDGTARVDSAVAGALEVDMLIEGRKGDMWKIWIYVKEREGEI